MLDFFFLISLTCSWSWKILRHSQSIDKWCSFLSRSWWVTPRILKNYSWTLNKFNSNLSSCRTTNYSTIFISQFWHGRLWVVNHYLHINSLFFSLITLCYITIMTKSYKKFRGLRYFLPNYPLTDSHFLISATRPTLNTILYYPKKGKRKGAMEILLLMGISFS